MCKNHFITFIGCLALITTVFGCATINVPVTVTHPAEINMKQYKEIAMADLNGNMGLRFGDELKNRLVESGRFNVISRNQMDKVMKELELSQSDLAESSKRMKLGRLMSASALIAGHAEGNYHEKTYSRKTKCYNKDQKEYPCTEYTKEGVFTINGSVDVIDIETGRILRSKALKSTKSGRTTATDQTPGPIDQESLKRQVIETEILSILKAVTPWTETRFVPFRKDKKIPELETAINHAKIGEMDQAVRIFASAIKSSEMNPALSAEQIANTYWNLGLAYECIFEFDKAVECLNKGFKLNPDDEFIKEKKNAESMKSEKAKLDEQI